MPREYVPGCRKGHPVFVMDSGPAAGFPVIYFRFAPSTVPITTWTPRSAFEIAARAA